MEATLDNLFIDVADLSYKSPVDLTSGSPPPPVSRTIQLTQSRLGIFLIEAQTGRPLVGLPLLVNVECDLRYQSKNASSGEVDEKSLHETLFSTRIPLGLLASDHLGYVSYDLTRLPDLVNLTDTRWKTLVDADAQEFQGSAQPGPMRISLKSIWIYPYGDYPFDGLKPGRFALRPDAIVITASLMDSLVRAETSRAGIPSMQEPSIVDWRLSPGSFAIAPLLQVGSDDCARMTPANLAIQTFYFQQVVLDAAPTIATVVPGSVPGVPPTPTTPKAVGSGGDPASGIAASAAGAAPASGNIGVVRAPQPVGALGASAPAAAPPTVTAAQVSVVPAISRSVADAATLAAPMAAQVRAEVRRGKIHIYRTQWFPLGHSLGGVLYSLALAPAESSNIAVIDWSREDTAVRDETTSLTEELIADLRRDRTISETINGALTENQQGGSTMAGGSLAAAGAANAGWIGGMIGLAMSVGGGSAWTSAERDMQFSTVQRLADRISQAASAVRELQSSVVVSAHQREQNVLTTRTLTNYNHSHTLTVLYYELLRHLRVVTAFDRDYDAYLVKFPPVISVDRSDPTSVLKYASFLRGLLIDPSLAPALDACAAFEIEMYRPDPAAQRTPDQDLILYGFTGTLSLMSKMDVEPNQTASAFRVFRRDVTGGSVTLRALQLAQSNPLSSPDSTQFYYPLPRVAGGLKDALGVSFSLVLGETLRWADLSHIEVQCVFDDSNHDKYYQVRLDGATALTERGPVALNVNPAWLGIPNSDEYPHHQWGAAGDAHFANPVALWIQGPAEPPAPRAPFDRLTPEQQQLIWRLLNHVADNIEEYSLRYWWTNDRARGEILAGLGTAFDASFTPVSVLGSYLVFPKLTSNPQPAVNSPIDERLITLPTRGVFADAKLGECNVSEFIDDRRFWDWQRSPIPFPAPEISDVHPESQKQQPTTALQPTQFPTPIVSIQTAPAAPDPSTAAALQAFTTPNIFRDMSIAQEVASTVAEVTKAARDVAIAAGSMVKASGTKSGSTTDGTGATAQQGGTTTPTTGGGTGSGSSVTSPASQTGSGMSTGTQTTTTGTGTKNSSGSSSPVQGRTNANLFSVVVHLPELYQASVLDVFGLSGVWVFKDPDPAYPNKFWVTFASDLAPDVATIDVTATITLAKTGVAFGQLKGHWATSTDKPLSRLKLMDCTPKTLELDITANEDIKRSESISNLQKWTLTGSGALSITPPQVEASIEELAKIKGWTFQGTIGGSVSQEQGTQVTQGQEIVVSKGSKFPISILDMGASEMTVVGIY